ncbi:MAG TPA: ABC transporter substrate-binding protein [Solirubrobacterales bacterium]|nr:ABC transporter substrate-binding protein [Solirubrobacterales bacterium]
MAAAVLLSGCGGGSGSDTAETTAAGAETSETETAASEAKTAEKCPAVPDRSLNVALDEWENPETAGILMANKRGYFADAGLEVSTLAPPGPAAVVSDVVAGYDAIGVSHEPEVVLAQEEGEPIVIVGSLVQKPTAALIWLKQSHIKSIADLKGKTIAIPGLPFQERFLEKALAQGGLTLEDVKVESVANEVLADLAGGRADAIFAPWNLRGPELEARGLDPVAKSVQSFGAPAYDEIVLIAQADCASQRPKIFRKFLSAVAHGTAAAIEDPEGAVKAFKTEYETNPETSRKALEAQIKATFPLLSKSGYVSPAQAQGLVDWMYEEGMIQRKVPVEKLLTNRYLTLQSSGPSD